MNEKIILKSEHSKKAAIYSGVLFAIGSISIIGIFMDGGFDAWVDYAVNNGLGIEFLLSWGGAAFLILGVYVYFMMMKCEIYITDKRIYGKAAFGNRVDIPIDSVSAVGMIGWIDGISVSSSSGIIKFFSIKNVEAMHKEISRLILNRVSNRSENPLLHDNASDADELKKYKDLLSEGVITQEEFEKKKKQLLGL